MDEDRFPIHPFDDVTTSSGYVGYWTWELRPALRGTTNLDNLGRFCAHFLLSLEGDDHLPLQLAHFVRDIYSKARKRTEIGTVEFDEIAYRIDSGLVCGYIQFRAGFIHEVWDWVREYGSLWLTDAYGPVYFKTMSHIIGHHTIKAWQAMIHVAIEYVLFLCRPGSYNDLSPGNSLIPAKAPFGSAKS